MIDIDTAPRDVLEAEILSSDNEGLYEMFNERKLMAEQYTTEEYRQVMHAWIIADPDVELI